MLGKTFSSKAKKNWTVLGIEVGAAVVVGVVLLLVLNYFQIVSLTRLSSFFDFLPTKILSFLKNDGNSVITANSARKDYKIKLDHPEVLLSIFNSYRVLERSSKGFNTEKPLKRAIITLTDEKRLQNKYVFGVDDIPIQFSYQLNSTGDTLVFFVYLPDEILKSPQASRIFGRAVRQMIVLEFGEKDKKDPLLENKQLETIFSISPGYGKTIDAVPTGANKAIPAGSAKK